MVGIIEGMTQVEVDALFASGPYGVWSDKLKELESFNSAYCIFEGLGDVLRLLKGRSGLGKGEEVNDGGEEEEEG